MRTLPLIPALLLGLALLGARPAAAQSTTTQPILYHRGTLNAASLAPFGLPNAPIARGSIFTSFGENLGPAVGQQVNAFPLQTTFNNVSISVTQGTTTTAAIPIYVSASQINAIMPSSVTSGLATLRVTYQSKKSNAITIQIADSAPGIFAVANAAGPGVIQNFITGGNQPVNDADAPAARGQVVTIWGTGLGPVTFPDTAAPTAGNVATPVSVTIGGQSATVGYSGRSPCCSGLDQIVVTVPPNASLGCWVPVLVTAGGVVSNATTMSIAAPGANTCDDPANPLSKLVRTPGTQAFIHLERIDSIENVQTTPPVSKTLDKIYTRFYTRPAAPFSFDPYLSLPPVGSCIVHQTSGDAYLTKSLRGVLPNSASLSPQPKQSYNNGSQTLTFAPDTPFFSSTLGGIVDGNPIAMTLPFQGSYTIDPAGTNAKVLTLNMPAAPLWIRNGVLVVPRNAPFSLSFTPIDTTVPTTIQINAYSAANNATVVVQCLSPSGTNSFAIPAQSLANLPATYGLIDGSYANMSVGNVGLNKATSFSSGLAANGIEMVSSWYSQSVVLQ